MATTLPQPDPLTDLAFYQIVADGYQWETHLALSRPGKIYVWGTAPHSGSAGPYDEAFFDDVPYVNGNSHLISYAWGYKAMCLNREGSVISWGELPEWEDSIWEDEYMPDPSLKFKRLIRFTWTSKSYSYNPGYNRYELWLTKFESYAAIREDGSYYYWRDPAGSTGTGNWYVIPNPNIPDGTYFAPPAIGMHYDTNLIDFGYAATVEAYDASLDKELYPMQGQAFLALRAAADKYTACHMSEAARATAWPKPGEYSVAIFEQAIMDDVVPLTEHFGKCHFYASADMVYDNGNKAVMSGGCYSLYTTASLGATNNDFIGQAFLKVEATRMRCVERNWDLLEQIQKELGISTVS